MCYYFFNVEKSISNCRYFWQRECERCFATCKKHCFFHNNENSCCKTRICFVCSRQKKRKRVLNQNEIFERNVDITYKLILLRVKLIWNNCVCLFIEFDYNAIASIAIRIHFCRIDCTQQFERKKSINLARVNNVIVIYNTFTAKTANCVFLRNVTSNDEKKNKIMIYCIVSTRIALSTLEKSISSSLKHHCDSIIICKSDVIIVQTAIYHVDIIVAITAVIAKAKKIKWNIYHVMK